MFINFVDIRYDIRNVLQGKFKSRKGR